MAPPFRMYGGGDGMLFHIATSADWEGYQAAGEIRPASLAAEGFVHASLAGQVLGTAGRHFAGREDLVLVALDPGRLGAEVVFEDLYGRGEALPHVYGPIPLGAVVGVGALRLEEGSRFVWPAGVPRGNMAP